MKFAIKWPAVAAAGALLAASFLAAGTPAAAQPSTTCSTTPTGGTIEKTIDGRPYRLFVPPGLSGPAPLIVALHGGQNNPANFETQSGWTGFSSANKVIVAYPRGSKNEGTDKWAWEFARNVGPDVPFLRDVVGDVAGAYCVAPERIHFAGHSNGGQMTSRMACDASDLIASAAAWAGAKGAWDTSADECPTDRPIAFGVMLNDNDPVIWQWVAEQHRDHWREMNDCGTEHSESGPGVLRGQRFDCAAGTQVVYRLYDGPDDVTKSHDWPAGDRGADVRNRMWALFNSNPLP
ncbi:alpha/beta hydrolase family esterase [Nocardia crassostreae]|uniref:alpha/beta hydrolase family esterase n=1 Tax=Nocardia crassostreae TaxID=53428 RepID=UPI00082BAFB6|nr:PHB depolymerase family esterase [Nocardia crassostreae]